MSVRYAARVTELNETIEAFGGPTSRLRDLPWRLHPQDRDTSLGEPSQWGRDVEPAIEYDSTLSCVHGRRGGSMCPHCVAVVPIVKRGDL